MKRLPDKATISISGHEYEFERVAKITLDGDDNYDGIFHPRDNVIYVRADMGEKQDAFVTLREMAHAIIHHSGLRNLIDDEKEEALADAFAYGILSVRVNGKPILR